MEDFRNHHPILRCDVFPLLSSSFKLSAISSQEIPSKKKGNGCRKIRIYSTVKRFRTIEKPQWLRHSGNQRKHLFKDKSREVALNIEERELKAGHEVFDSSSKINGVFQLT